MVSLGIDLGTKNCCMAVCKGNEVDVIPYSNNSRTVPSYISFWNQEILFGDVAIKRMPKNLGNTVYDIKRLIGRQFSDPVVTSHVDRWDFEVIDKNESVAVGVDQGDERIFYTPQELNGLLLIELKTTAELYLGEIVYNAVITVPTYFTDSQRQATVDAGRIAGFKEVRLLNEPTAAALAYNMKTLRKEKRTVLVFDFGGGTLDVSLVECEGENVRVLAIGGDQNLGGNDIDQLLVEYMESTYDLDLNEKQLFRLRMVCEEAKKQFSVTEEVDVELFDEDEEIVLERKTFNEICKDIYTKTLAVVESCLNGIKFDVDDVHELLMVGGSSKIQRIVTMLETHFKKPVRRTLNPDEAVAIGAAIYASKWNLHSSLKGVNYIKVCPYSLGIDVFNKNNPEQGRNIMDPLIKKLDPLPVKISKKYFTVKDLQTELTFNIYSGEDNLVTNNKWLGHITIKGLKPVPSRQVGVDVTFELDMNGILNVSLSDPENGTSEHLKLVLEEIGYNEKDLKTTIDLIQKRYSKSLEVKAFKQRKNHLGDLCDSVKTRWCRRCDKAKARLEHLDFNAENSKWLEHVIKDLERH